MSLVYITGISGAGKSSVSAELKRRGYEAYDADQDGFNTWYTVGAETKVAVPYNDWGDTHSQIWLHDHVWHTSRTKVAQLAKKSEGKLIFLCGTSGNEREMFDLFSQIICLDLDEKTLRHRLATRTNNKFGKAKHELDLVLNWHKGHADWYRGLGATIIDSSKPLSTVVDNILKIIGPHIAHQRQSPLES